MVGPAQSPVPQGDADGRRPPSRSPGARLRRHLLLLAAALVVVILVLHGSMSVYQEQRMRAALQAAEERWGALDDGGEARPPVADEMNAAVLLRRAAAEHDLDTRTLPALNRLKQGRQGEPEDDAILQGMLERNAGALAALEAALDRPGLDWRAPPPAGSHQQPGALPLTRLMPLAGTNWASGMLAAAAGDTAAAVDAARRQFLLARAIGDADLLMPQVLRIRVATQALDLVRAILTRTAPDAGELALLARALDAMEGSEALQRAAVAEFKERTLIYLRAMGGEAGTAAETGAAPDDSFDLRATAVERAGRSLRGENPMTPDDVEYLGGAATRFLLRPVLYRRMASYLESSDAMLDQLSTRPHRRQEEVAGGGGEEGWLARILPDLQLDRQLLAMGDLLDARLALARAAVALCRARAETGGYPPELDGLVPAYLAHEVVDPLTGEAPVYRRTEGGFTLASRRADLETEQAGREPWGPTGLLTWALPFSTAENRDMLREPG